MLFNLLETGYVTASGTIPFSLETISEILSVSGTLTISGSNDDSFWIYGDIVDRIAVSQIRYYFDSSTSSGTVASGISFYYKNDAADSFSLLTTNVGPGYYYTTVPGVSAPRYIRLNHTVSGTGITGTVVGFEVLNYDSIVDFGAAGELTSETILTSSTYLGYNDYIKDIAIFNNGTTTAAAHVYLDPQHDDVDALLSISDSETGPWIFARNTDYIIVDGNNYMSGNYDGTYTEAYNNYWDTSHNPYYVTFTNGDLTAQSTYATNKNIISTQSIFGDMLFSKKWYWEIYIDNLVATTPIQVGIAPVNIEYNTLISANANGYCYRSNATKCNNSSCTSYGNTYTTGDVIGVAFDVEAGKIWFSKNGVWQASGDPVTGANPAYSGISSSYNYVPASSIYDSGDKVTAQFVSTTYTPPEGFLIFEVLVSDGKLRLYSNALIGQYTTPIFRNESAKYAYIDLVATTVSGAKLAVDAEDYTSTIEIRSHNQKPKDYNAYRKIQKSGRFYYYKEYLLDSDLEVFNSYNYTGEYFCESPNTTAFGEYYNVCHINSLTGRSHYIICHSYAYGNYKRVDMYLILLNFGGFLLFSKLIFRVYTSDVDPGLDVRYIESGADDDLWTYLYVHDASEGGYDISSGGYYLFHHDSLGTKLYSEYSTSDFISTLDMVKSTGELWYARAVGTIAILKLDTDGTTLYSYDDVTEIVGLCATEDGGCWFIDNDVLYKLNSEAELEDSIPELEVDDTLTHVMRDDVDSNYLWIVDGAYIKFISSLDGRVYRNIHLEDFTIDRLYSTSEYLVVIGTDNTDSQPYIKLIGRDTGGVFKTIANDGATITAIRGIKAVSYDNINLGNLIPLDDDPYWNDDLPWNKVVTANAILPREEYNQLRLTLRRPSVGINAPIVDNIYYQDSVTLTDIEPEQSKSIYLRVSIPDNMSFGGEYLSNLRVWWEELIP